MCRALATATTIFDHHPSLRPAAVHTVDSRQLRYFIAVINHPRLLHRDLARTDRVADVRDVVLASRLFKAGQHGVPWRMIRRCR